MIWQSVRAKEHATDVVKKELNQLNLLLLDDTVAWKGWKKEGRYWWRVYEFEFTSTAEERYQGIVRLSTRHQPRLLLPPYRLDHPPHEPLH